LRCILSLIAHAIIVTRNWSVAGSIGGRAARSDTQIQAAHEALGLTTLALADKRAQRCEDQEQDKGC
jgi:hypothetical protein